MIPTRIRSVSLSKKIARTITTNLLILALVSLPSAPVTDDSHLSTSSDPPPSYTALASRCHPHLVPKLHPTKTRVRCRGKPVHIDFIDPSHITMKHNEVCIHRECTWGWARGVGW